MEYLPAAGRTISRPTATALLIAITATVVAVSLAVVAVWRLSASETQTHAPPADAAALQPSHSGELWSVAVSPSFDGEVPGTSLVAWDQPTPTIYWIDSEKRVATAAITTSHSVAVTGSASAQRLIVSDATKMSPDDGISNEGTRLLIYEIGDGIRLEREIPLPDRIRYPIYGLPFVLSESESVLHYLRYLPDPDAPGCIAGDWMACDSISVVRLDLESGAETGSIELPKGCYPHLQATPSDGVLAGCSSGLVLVFDEQLELVRTAEFTPSSELPLTAAFVAEDGVVAVFRNGDIMTERDDGTRSTLNVLESGATVGRPVLLPSGVVGVGITEDRRNPYVSGFLFVDLESGDVERLDIPAAQAGSLGADGTAYWIVDGVVYRQPRGAAQPEELADMRAFDLPGSVASVAIVP